MPDGTPFRHGGTSRPHGGSLSRFTAYTHKGGAPDRAGAALRPDHAALREKRGVFPTRVFEPTSTQSVLVSGHSNAKTGGEVRKGAWRGMPIYTLSLEERATCPSTCHLWAECYGNAMPLAKRWRHGPKLIDALDADLRRKARLHPGGFVVRLHVLGDFWSEEYAFSWLAWLDGIPELRVFGYTAHAPDSPIGAIVAMANDRFPGRAALRFSGAPETPADWMQATTIWREPEGPRVAEGLVCPAQEGKTAACGTCGLCWAPAMADTRIVFLGHGRRPAKGPRGPRTGTDGVPIATPPPATAELGTLRITLSADPALLAVLDRIAKALGR